MIRLMYKCRGAVSIFLIIVMVPMLVVSSIFVDTSRINLARAVAASAGDLTLNTALTDYDSVLKDMYGLFATSQDIDKLLENLEDYYKKAIISAGVDEIAAGDYAGQMISMLKSATGSDDLMRMEVVDFSAQKPTGASLANPSITKAQIVEFMKYRAPLNLGASFFEALENLKTLDAQTKMLDDKNKFYQEEQSLLENLERAWSEIQKYQYASANDGFPTGDYITKNAQWLAMESQDFKDSCVSVLINYLTYYDSFRLPKAPIGVAVRTETDGVAWYIEGYSSNTYYITYSEETKTDDQIVLDDLISFYRALKKLQDIKDDRESTYFYIENLSAKSNPSDIEKIYAVARYCKDGSSEYEGAVKTLLSVLATLKSDADSCDFKGDLYVETDNVRFAAAPVNVGGIPLKDAVDFVLQEFDPSKTEDTPFVEYKQIGQQLTGYYNDLKSKLDAYASNVSGKAQILRDHAKGFYDLLRQRSNNLNNAISTLQQIHGQISDPNSEYNTKMANWKKSAEKIPETSMGQSNLGEIEELKKFLNAEDVTKLITRLTAAKNSVDTVMQEIANYKFGGKSWKDFSDKVDANELFGQISAIKTQTESIVPSGGDAYSAPISNAQARVVVGNIKTTWPQAEDPNLAGKDQVQLYTWLYNNYYDPNMNYGEATNADKTKAGEKALKDQKKSLDEKAKGYDEQSEGRENKTTQITDRSVTNYAEFLPTKEWPELLESMGKAADLSVLEKVGSEKPEERTNSDTELSDASSGTSTLLSRLINELGNMTVTLRDDMYITDYAMTMFSYNTFETEMTKKYGDDGDMGAFESWYERSEDGTYALKNKYEEHAAQALNLTNNPINPKLNYLYGSEVEYIIYGGTEPSGNIAAAYATIFMLRFALNTVYAFTDAEINNTTLAAATAIFGAPPLTPMVPIAKAAMIVGLSIAETAYDLYVLKGGDAVPLMKTNSTWMMKPTRVGKELASKAASEVAEVAVNAAIDKGYEVLTNLIDKTDEELEAIIDEGEDAIIELAGAASESALQSFYNYAHEAVDKAAELCRSANMAAMREGDAGGAAGDFADLKSTPEKVKLVTEGLQSWLAEQPRNGAIYEVKKAAVDYLTADGGGSISNLFGVMQQQAVAKNEDEQEKAMKAIEEMLGSFRKDIQDKVNAIAKDAGSKLHDMRKKMENELKEAAKNGAESLRKKLKEQLTTRFGTSEVGQAGSTGVVASLLSWSYSDYLTLFLLIATLANEEGVLLRMEDMIQLNMQHMQGEYASIVATETKMVSRLFGLWKVPKPVDTVVKNEKAYQLSKAYTYLEIDATIEVKPLLMKIPFIADVTEKELNGKNWYTIQYSGVLGY